MGISGSGESNYDICLSDYLNCSKQSWRIFRIVDFSEEKYNNENVLDRNDITEEGVQSDGKEKYRLG